MTDEERIVTVEQWLELPGPHKDPGGSERWRERLEVVVVGDVGEFFQTDDVEPTLGWTWYADETSLTLRPLAAIVEDTQPSSPYRFLDLRAAIGPVELLYGDRRSPVLWCSGRSRRTEVAARLDRPDDLEDDALFLRFRVSPDGSWIIAFAESGFAAFHRFEVRMVERYDELLWEPLEVTDTSVTIGHYTMGRRHIPLLT